MSPLLQHKIDLFSAGLEYNVAAGVSLDDSRKALSQLCSSQDSLQPIEERVVERGWPEYVGLERPAGGVYPIVNGSSIRLFTLGSASRRIPHKEWEIPLPVVDLTGFGFDPGADVIALVELQQAKCVHRSWKFTTNSAQLARNFKIEIHMRTLSDGGYHPSARYPTIHYSQGGARVYKIISVPITSSRLAVSANVQSGMYLIVWDWRNAQVLFVCQ